MTVLNDLMPTPLQLFSAGTLAELRNEGKCESLYFEFKRTWMPDDVTRCVTAFANGHGGFLLLGVNQTDDGCIESFPGLDPGQEYPTLAKDRIVGHISPLPTWDAVAVASPDDSERAVLVIRVERSNVTPHVVTRTGRIYIRTPAACDPVLDRATIDNLTARGRAGSSRLEARWGELLASPWSSRRGQDGTWSLVVGAFPLSVGEPTYPDLLTRGGREMVASLFAGTDGTGASLVRMVEDGLLLQQGLAQIAVGIDGAVMYRISGTDTEIPNHPRTAPLAWVEGLIQATLGAQSSLVPPIRQVTMRVDLMGTAGFRVGRIVNGFWDVSDEVLAGDWRHTRETLTDRDAASATAEAITRRLRRAAGDPAYEPD